MWDVGGQKTIRAYWRNYFEQVRVASMVLYDACGSDTAPQTDGLIWVVDSADRRRLRDCKRELLALLGAEVRPICAH